MCWRYFCVRNQNSNSGQAGQLTPIILRRDYLKGQGTCSLGRDPFLIWIMQILAYAFQLLGAILVGSPTNLFLSTCMVAVPVSEGRMLHGRFSQQQLSLERMGDPGTAWTEPCLGQRLQLPVPDRDLGGWSAYRSSMCHGPVLRPRPWFMMLSMVLNHGLWCCPWFSMTISK